MSREPRPIPHGRGYRKGDDALIDQREGDLLRQAVASKKQGWLFSALMSPFMSGDTGANVFSDETLFLCPVGYLDNVLNISHARLAVANGVAATRHHSAIYTLNIQNRNAYMVPQTYVIFDTASAGRQEVPLAQTIVLEKNRFYFIGNVAEGKPAANIACISHLGYDPTSGLTASGYATPPKQVPLPSMSNSGSTLMPHMGYLSPECAAIL